MNPLFFFFAVDENKRLIYEHVSANHMGNCIVSESHFQIKQTIISGVANDIWGMAFNLPPAQCEVDRIQQNTTESG